MAWNRPSESKQAAQRLPKKAVLRNIVLFCAALLSVAGVLIFLHSWFDDSRPSKNSSVRSGYIAESAPHIYPVDVSPAKEKVEQAQVKKEEDIPLFYTNKLGEVKRIQNREGVVVQLTPRKKIFTNMSDVVISDILSVLPGQLSYATVPSNFDELFAKSLLEKIEFSEDDTEEDRIKKERVIAARKELKERWKAGESAAQILKDEQKRLGKLAEKYEFYKGEVQNLRASGATPKEVAELVAAARIAMQNDDIKIGLSMNWDEHLALRELEKETGIIWQNK